MAKEDDDALIVGLSELFDNFHSQIAEQYQFRCYIANQRLIFGGFWANSTQREDVQHDTEEYT